MGKNGGTRISRKDLFRLAGAGGAGLALGATGHAGLRGTAEARDAGDEAAGPVPDVSTVPFYGRNQAGIATAQQEHMHFASLDLVSEDVSEGATPSGLGRGRGRA